MVTRANRAFAFAVSLLVVGGLSTLVHSPRWHTVPVHAGDSCFRCAERITEPALAAEIVRFDGSLAYKFRTVGCLLAYLSQGGHLFDDVFVTDWPTGRFVPITQATFVHTVVNHGLREEGDEGLVQDYVAFRSREAAERFARQTGGQVMDWAAVRGFEQLVVSANVADPALQPRVLGKEAS